MLSKRGLLGVIAGIEFFERFGFYSVQGILILYLINIKGYDSLEAYHIFGAFSALLYGFVGLGGVLGDKVFGPKRTMFVGLLVMFLGYFGLTAFTHAYFFPALALVCMGNALFKANPAAILGHMYQDNKTKLHSAFTLFYMAVNVGALFALIVGPYLSSYFNDSYVFASSAVGILLALMLLYINRKEPNLSKLNHSYQPLSCPQWILAVLVFIAAWA